MSETLLASNNQADAQTQGDTPEQGDAQTVASDRPEWLPEKFWDGDNAQPRVEDLAKSYINLEKHLGQKGKIAPEKYELALEGFEIPEDDEVYSGFQEFAKEQGMSNDAFNGMLKFALDKGIIAPPLDRDAELKKLGQDATQTVSFLNEFAESKLSESERDLLYRWAGTAEEVKLLSKLVKLSKPMPIPTRGDSQPSSKGDLEKQLKAIIANPEYRKNRDLQEDAKELSRRIAGE